MRIGYGYDVHRLVEGRKLILGGVEIPYNLGLLGHSDADVLIHAVIDAILGALAAGDIGQMYPDSDQKYRNINSRKLLQDTTAFMLNRGYQISNLDSTICAQNPKLMSYLPEMREILAADLQTDPANVSVKATTEEGLGISGENKGISATAIVLLKRES
ncbi:MAG: 2-C-methyl-D-erythritol 2,4-cyclodiphosphate synthase [Candidatus Cloacimonetes bacterium]|nr:2-C-methyl-D-erythritol 2,4-cyclodiphosphate synthase [Candidatus Cloacimonadota bacterium]